MSTPDRNETIVKRDSRIHTATATQYRFTVHVPAFYNTGAAVTQNVLDDIRDTLIAAFGAFTRTAGWGEWRDDTSGIVYSDAQWLYQIDCTSDQCGQTVREIAARIRSDLNQECVYVTRQSIDTWLV